MAHTGESAKANTDHVVGDSFKIYLLTEETWLSQEYQYLKIAVKQHVVSGKGPDHPLLSSSVTA